MIVAGAAQLGPLLNISRDELELNQAIGELRKYSLVKRDPEKKISEYPSLGASGP